VPPGVAAMHAHGLQIAGTRQTGEDVRAQNGACAAAQQQPRRCFPSFWHHHEA
jgi:hypothetical protein